MEMDTEKESITTNVQERMFLLLQIAGEVFPLLQETGMGSSEGIIFFTETVLQKEELLWLLKKTGAVLCRSPRKLPENCRNNKIHVYVPKQYDAVEKIYDFLYSDEYLSAVLLCGILPEYAQEKNNILVFENNEEKDEEMISKGFFEQMQKIRAYVRKHPDTVLRELRLLKKSDAFKHETVYDHSMQKMLKAAGHVWWTCFSEDDEYEEEQGKMGEERLWDTVDIFQNLSETYRSGENVAYSVGKMLRKYVEEHEEIEVCDTTEISIETTRLIEERKVILQDTDFYFVPEDLLKKACRSLLETISFLAIKKELCATGYLLKNEGSAENYTVKLLITNTAGFSCRPRFLKLKKELVESVRSLGFSKKGEELCIWGNFRKDVV